MAINARKQAKTDIIAEAEAKKQGYFVPKPLKLAMKGNDVMIDILPA